MTAIFVQSYFCFESLVNATVALVTVLGISIVTDFWNGSVTHKFPEDGSSKVVREIYVDGSPAIKKSARITYGPRSR